MKSIENNQKENFEKENKKIEKNQNKNRIPIIHCNEEENKNSNLIDNYPELKLSLGKKRQKSIPKKETNINIKNEAYSLRTVLNNSGYVIILTINAPNFLKEYLIPIWFETETFIKFSTKGKWRIDKQYEFTDASGMASPPTVHFNYGALIGRIGSGESFMISGEEFSYITRTEGPLYLRINLPKKIEVNPEGTMEVRIYDGTVMPLEEIYERIGWKENSLKYEITEPSEIENELIGTFNNLRMNPILFYEKYIRDSSKYIIWTKDFLKQKTNDELKPFSVNDKCYILLNDSRDTSNVKTKLVKQTMNVFLDELQDYLSCTISYELQCDIIINCKFTKKNEPSDICMQFLLDNKFRDYIFDYNYNSIAIKFIENYFIESHLVVLAILKEKDKDI